MKKALKGFVVFSIALGGCIWVGPIEGDLGIARSFVAFGAGIGALLCIIDMIFEV